MRRFLFVSPYFPPDECQGGRRTEMLCRHLPDKGWAPVVWTRPATNAPPVPFDPVVRMVRTMPAPGATPPRSQQPSRPAREWPWRNPWLTPLDQFMWGLPLSIPRAIHAAREHGCEAVAVNADPWSGLLIARGVQRALGIPFIADLQDPWALCDGKMQFRPALTQKLIHRLERYVVTHCDALILNTQAALHRYQRHYPQHARKMARVRNAFEGPLAHPAAPSGPPSIHYYGGFNPQVDIRPFLAAFTAFAKRTKAELVLYGEPPQAVATLLRETEAAAFVRVVPRIPSQDTRDALSQATALLLLEGPQRELQIPMKFYDYLASGRPVLAVGAPGELSRMVTDSGAGIVCAPTEHAVTRGLKRVCGPWNAPRPEALAPYTAETQAAEWAAVADRVVTHPVAAAHTAQSIAL